MDTFNTRSAALIAEVDPLRAAYKAAHQEHKAASKRLQALQALRADLEAQKQVKAAGCNVGNAGVGTADSAAQQQLVRNRRVGAA